MYYQLLQKFMHGVNRSKAELREKKRKEFVEAIVVRGGVAGDVARVYSIPICTVSEWLARYWAGGWGALREGARGGRARKLGGGRDALALRRGDGGRPAPAPVRFLPLDARGHQEPPEEGAPDRALQRLLRHFGLSPQRPIYTCYKQDPKQIERYLERTFPELLGIARGRGAAIYFLDEAVVRSDNHRGTTWGKLGQTPVVSDGGGRFGLKLISAVSPRGDMRFGFVEERMNSAKFIAFLKKLRRDTEKPLIVIADNANYHASKAVSNFATDPENEVWAENLPAYAPELNPDEQAWTQAKHRLAKLFIENKEGMKRSMKNIMLLIQKNTNLVRSFFELQDTTYAKVDL